MDKIKKAIGILFIEAMFTALFLGMLVAVAAS